MSLMHKILAGALRAAGRHREAGEVEEAGTPEPARRPVPPEPVPESGPVPESRPSAPATVPDTSRPRDGGTVAAASSSSSQAAASSPGGAEASTSAAGCASGGGRKGEHESGGKGAAANEAEEEKEKRLDPTRPGATPEHASPATLDADPLAGLHSERLRDCLERDAFRAASGDAQDSAIWRNASRTLPLDVLRQFQPGTPHPGASSRAARAARIDALRGEIPHWAKGDPQNDPTLLRATQPRTRGRVAPQRAAAPAPKPAPARAHEGSRER